MRTLNESEIAAIAGGDKSTGILEVVVGIAQAAGAVFDAMVQGEMESGAYDIPAGGG